MSNLFESIFKFFKGADSGSNMQAHENHANDNITALDDGLIDVSWAGYETK